MIPFTEKDIRNTARMLNISEEEVLRRSKDKKLRAEMLQQLAKKISDVIWGNDEVFIPEDIKIPKV